MRRGYGALCRDKTVEISQLKPRQPIDCPPIRLGYNFSCRGVILGRAVKVVNPIVWLYRARSR